MGILKLFCLTLLLWLLGFLVIDQMIKAYEYEEVLRIKNHESYLQSLDSKN